MNTPIIVFPVPADDLNKGSPSDHSVLVAIPLQSAEHSLRRDMKTKVFRPMPESKLETFKTWITEVEWDSLITPKSSPSKQVDEFQAVMESKINEVFPNVSVRRSLYDKPWITNELKKIIKM